MSAVHPTDVREESAGDLAALRIRVWDLPIRVFHWLLLPCVAVALVTAQLGGNWMPWHVRAGGLTVGLLVFRLVWGLIGPRYSRFKSFLYSPRAVFESLSFTAHRHRPYAGHSPSGAASVFALLMILFVQSASGLFSSDSIDTEGALVRFGTESIVSAATWLHVSLQWVVYGLIGLHVLVIFGWLLLGKDLIRPMLCGDKLGIRAEPAADTVAVRIGGMVLMMTLLVMCIWLIT